jgi:hypothetical protein
METDPPDVRALLQVGPAATITVLRFKLKPQGARIMIRDQLQGAEIIQMLEELEDHGMADARLQLAHVNQPLAFDGAAMILRAMPPRL